MNLTNRPRRLRSSALLRSMVRETRISADTLVYPMFVQEGTNVKEEIPSMPGQYRWSLDRVDEILHQVSDSGVKSVLLFGIPAQKDEVGSSAWQPDGIVQRAIRHIKAAFPQFYVITDVCMCEYTSHGHCGVLCGHDVDNDQTLEVLAKTALSHVQAGADMVAPSDMMDGRVGRIRQVLDENGFVNTPIMAYSVKYASAFYGPFRDAAGSAPAFGDRKGYQMDPHNRREALRECALDAAEGADILMVKPALSYLDVIRECSDAFDLPMCAYSVSGEYAMTKAAAAAGLIDEYRVMCESAVSIFRAGADILITYYAKELAQAIYKEHGDSWKDLSEEERLDKLAEIWQTNKKTPAIVEFVDIAGLVKGASQGAGLGNKFLGHIRECDAIVHVVRCFDDDNIIHVVEDVTKAEAVDPIADIDAIDYELILSDLEVVQNRAGRMAKAAKSGNNKGAAAEAAWLQQLADHLSTGKPARSFDFDPTDTEQQTVLHEMGLLSAKPVLYACNVGEDDLMEGIENNKYVPLVAARAKEEGARYIPICAKTEEDIADYSPEEKKAFLAEMGIEASGLDNLITASYDLLGLISFLTDGKKECRAWTIRKGTKAPQAAGKIHSDFERGFIRASVIGYNDLEANNFDYAAVKAKGLQRTEGKEYVVHDGDVIEFLFNV